MTDAKKTDSSPYVPLPPRAAKILDAAQKQIVSLTARLAASEAAHQKAFEDGLEIVRKANAKLAASEAALATERDKLKSECEGCARLSVLTASLAAERERTEVLDVWLQEVQADYGKLEADRDRLRSGPVGPSESCSDCGRVMIWSYAETVSPVWMCPRCTLLRAQLAESLRDAAVARAEKAEADARKILADAEAEIEKRQMYMGAAEIQRDAALSSLAAAEETHRGECAACQAECAICERGQPAATYSRAVDEVFEWIETNSWRTAETREERAARFLTSRKEHG